MECYQINNVTIIELTVATLRYSITAVRNAKTRQHSENINQLVNKSFNRML